MKGLCTVLALFTAVVLHAQQGVYGVLLNHAEKPLVYKEVRLVNTANSVTDVILSNTDGAFGFDIKDTGEYALEISLDTSHVYRLTNIRVYSDSATDLTLVFSKAMLEKRFSGRQRVLTSAQISKMPTTDAKEMLNRYSTFASGRASGSMHCVTDPSKSPVTYIVDGMVLPPTSTVFFTPGSLQNIEVLKD